MFRKLVGWLAITACAQGHAALLPAAADTFVSGGANASTIYGGDANLLISNMGADLSLANKMYLDFDLSSLDHDVVSYWMQFSFLDTGMGDTVISDQWRFDVYALPDGPDELWDQSTLDWTAAPYNDTGSADGVLTGAVFVQYFHVSGMGLWEISIGGGDNTPLVDHVMADTNDRLTLVFVRQTEGDEIRDYIHGISALSVRLNLQAPAIPEPTMALAAIVLAMTRRPRHRRYGHAGS